MPPPSTHEGGAVIEDSELERVDESKTGWALCADIIKNHDEATLCAWERSIDTLLTVAGLFTSALISFNVAYYTTLTGSASQSSSTIMLQVAMHTDNYGAITPTYIQIPQVESASSFRPHTSDVVINTLWFSSLTFILISASVGILVKQWLQEYRQKNWRIPRYSLRIRQKRWEGLKHWHVRAIMNLQSPLLQIGLLLFVIGLLILLWKLHFVVAIVPTICFCIWWSFWFVSMLLSCAFSSCPYKSSEAASLFTLWQKSISFTKALLSKGFLPPAVSRALMALPLPVQSGRPAARVVQCLLSLNGKCARAFSGMNSYEDLHDREETLVRDDKAFSQSDREVLLSADKTSVDDSLVAKMAEPCIQDLTPADSIHCILQLLARHLRIDKKRITKTYIKQELTFEPASRKDPVTKSMMGLAMRCLKEASKPAEGADNSALSKNMSLLLMLLQKWVFLPNVSKTVAQDMPDRSKEVEHNAPDPSTEVEHDVLDQQFIEIFLHYDQKTIPIDSDVAFDLLNTIRERYSNNNTVPRRGGNALNALSTLACCINYVHGTGIRPLFLFLNACNCIFSFTEKNKDTLDEYDYGAFFALLQQLHRYLVTVLECRVKMEYQLPKEESIKGPLMHLPQAILTLLKSHPILAQHDTMKQCVDSLHSVFQHPPPGLRQSEYFPEPALRDAAQESLLEIGNMCGVHVAGAARFTLLAIDPSNPERLRRGDTVLSMSI